MTTPHLRLQIAAAVPDELEGARAAQVRGHLRCVVGARVYELELSLPAQPRQQPPGVTARRAGQRRRHPAQQVDPALGALPRGFQTLERKRVQLRRARHCPHAEVRDALAPHVAGMQQHLGVDDRVGQAFEQEDDAAAAHGCARMVTDLAAADCVRAATSGTARRIRLGRSVSYSAPGERRPVGRSSRFRRSSMPGSVPVRG